MSTLAFSLIGLGAADFVAGGLAGQPRKKIWIPIAALLAMLIASLGCVPAKSLVQAGVYLLVFALMTGSWIWLRFETKESEPDPPKYANAKAHAAIFVLFLLLAWILVPGASFESTLPAWVDRLTASPVPLFRSHSPETLLGGVGVLAVLGATTNGLVRTVLRASKTEVDKPSAQLRGGRLIGMLERWLIFALAAGGEPTAAALVVSAKSLVRFPELTSSRDSEKRSEDGKPREVDFVTEYFLLGSMVSWMAAVVPVMLLSD